MIPQVYPKTLVEIKTKCNKVINLDELMINIEWDDYPYPGGSPCFSCRRVESHIAGEGCLVIETSHCGSNGMSEINVYDISKKIAKSKAILSYKEKRSYYRSPEEGKTYFLQDKELNICKHCGVKLKCDECSKELGDFCPNKNCLY